MKKTSFFNSPTFVFRTIRGLAAAVLVATALLFVLPLATPLRAESATAKVNGQISVILEGWIDGEDAFIFRDGKVSIQHKSFKVPYKITVNGKQWTDLSKPFELGFTPDPTTTKFTCEGRGTSSLTRTDDSITVSVYDQQGAATYYRIILFQPSGVKSPLAQPKKPIDKTVMEIPTGSTLASQSNAGGMPQTGESATAKRGSVSTQPIDRNNEDTTIETVTTTEENDDTIVQTTVVTETKNGKVVKKTTTTTTTTKEKPTSKIDAKPTSSSGTSATKTSSSSETDSSTTKKITNPFGTTQRPVEDDE